MGSKAIKNRKLTDTLTMSECKDGYWLYDYTRSMNLSMKVKTEEDAFVEAITYYQKRTKEVEDKLNRFDKSINSFIESISDEL